MKSKATSKPEPVTAVFSQTVKPGKEKQYDKVQHDLIRTAHRFDGHEEARVIKEGGRYYTIHRFADSRRLDKWLGSPEREALLKRIRPLVKDEEIKLTQLTGFEAWFRAPAGQAAPPRWKMLLATMLGAFPVVVFFQGLIAPHILHWHLLLRSAVYMVALLSIMTYLIMPHVTRWLAGWLYRK
jgi:antibiotic biosynthesis monooxygenase (ABM) superfamily enzyme